MLPSSCANSAIFVAAQAISGRQWKIKMKSTKRSPKVLFSPCRPCRPWCQRTSCQRVRRRRCTEMKTCGPGSIPGLGVIYFSVFAQLSKNQMIWYWLDACWCNEALWTSCVLVKCSDLALTPIWERDRIQRALNEWTCKDGNTCPSWRCPSRSFAWRLGKD